MASPPHASGSVPRPALVAPPRGRALVPLPTKASQQQPTEQQPADDETRSRTYSPNYSDELDLSRVLQDEEEVTTGEHARPPRPHLTIHVPGTSPEPPATTSGSSLEEETSEEFNVPPTPTSTPRTPTLYWLVLLAALLAISCAGTIFRSLPPSTPPLLKCFWRLIFVSWYLAVGFAVQWRQASADVKARFLSPQTLLVLLVSGAVMSLHFASWVWSLQHTSLSHSLFFVCSHPVIIVCGLLLCGSRVSHAELGGVALGLAGSLFMLLDDVVGSRAKVDSTAAASADGSSAIPVSALGDFAAFVGALAFVAYLFAGKHCRAFLPVFMFAFPMTLVAAMCALALSFALEEVSWGGMSTHSVFGFLQRDTLPTMLLLVLGPGITGHLGIQFVLSHIPPLAISLAITAEPILGTLIGVLAGVEQAPHALTLVGGPLTLAGCTLAIVGEWHRQKQEEQQQRQPVSSDLSSTEASDVRASAPASSSSSVSVEMEHLFTGPQSHAHAPVPTASPSAADSISLDSRPMRSMPVAQAGHNKSHGGVSVNSARTLTSSGGASASRPKRGKYGRVGMDGEEEEEHLPQHDPWHD